METAAAASSRICRLIEREPPRWLLLVFLCLVIFVRGRVVASLDTNGLWADPDGYSAVAANLVEHGAFAQTTYYGRPVLTAARPPLYPLLLAALSLGGDNPVLFGAMHVVLGTATVAGVWYLGRLWSLAPGVSLLAAALVMIDPLLLAHSAKVMTETLAALLVTTTLIAVTRAAARPSWKWALAAGVSAGLSILCRPEFLIWAAGIIVLFPFAAEGSHRLARLAVCVAALAVVLAPWAIRNQRAFGSPVFTTTHGGFTLLLANNPSFYEYLRSAPWGSTWDGHDVYLRYRQLQRRSTPPLYVRTSIHRPQMAIDEVTVDHEAYREAFQNILAEPGMFAWSSLVRVGRLWNVLPHQTSADESPSRRGLRFAVAIWYAFEFALAAAGVWFLRRKLLVHPWLWGVLLVASITAVHALYWTDMRMRAPVTGVVALAAASGLASLACQSRRKYFKNSSLGNTKPT